MQEKEIHNLIKTLIASFSNLILENAGVYRSYTDEDMANVMWIFQEVFMSKMWDNHKNKLSPEQRIKLTEEAGKSLHQTVLLFTGIDLKKIYETDKKDTR